MVGLWIFYDLLVVGNFWITHSLIRFSAQLKVHSPNLYI
jgi:hypothetical protein